MRRSIVLGALVLAPHMAAAEPPSTYRLPELPAPKEEGSPALVNVLDESTTLTLAFIRARPKQSERDYGIPSHREQPKGGRKGVGLILKQKF